MEHRRQTFTASLLLSVAIVFLSTTIRALDENEHESDFDYIEDSPKGPAFWSQLRKEWATCKDGKLQSPIDLSTQTVIPCSEDLLETNYKPHHAILVNRGHDISLRWDGDAGSININGTDFFLHQGHWHSPSEHTINGVKHNMEMHLVHLTRDAEENKKIAVVSTLFKIGTPNPLLTELSTYLSGLVVTNQEQNVGVIDPSKVNVGVKNYYRYTGSLTSPPCTEGVIWIINKQIDTVSMEQIKLLKDAVHEGARINARAVQPLNGRQTMLCGSDTSSAMVQTL